MLNPAVPGFHPDPSLCRAGDAYYLACSSFEYHPGIPLFRSEDAEHWEPIGHVATRAGQLTEAGVPTGGGVWAPTIRFHDGRFWLVVADAMGRGPLVFTAEHAQGPWSDGTPLVGVPGIDHDIAWDADGTCYVTYSGLILEGPELGKHLGIQQARLDLETGLALEEPRSLYSGTGGKFPEAPHLYEVDGAWYLMIAEGGTERGHSISIARAERPDGPFVAYAGNPIYTHRGTGHPVQNAGHGDLVQTDDGWRIVFLGTRPTGATQSFAAMGRETYQSRVEWVDGWPVVEPIVLTPDLPGVDIHTDLGRPLGLEWLSVRSLERPWLSQEAGELRLTAPEPAPAGPAMDDSRPHFLGRRQQHMASRCSAGVRIPGAGAGGLSVRYDERHHYDVELDTRGEAPVVRARVRLDQIEHTWEVPAPGDAAVLWISMVPSVMNALDLESMTCDTVHLGFGDGADEQTVAVMDGRYLSSDVCASFTGRVTGLYAAAGSVVADAFRYEGRDA